MLASFWASGTAQIHLSLSLSLSFSLSFSLSMCVCVCVCVGLEKRATRNESAMSTLDSLGVCQGKASGAFLLYTPFTHTHTHTHTHTPPTGGSLFYLPQRSCIVP